MNQRNWTQRNPTQDPLGPGSPTWTAFDQAVQHAADRNTRLYSAAQARMCRLVRANGGNVAQWQADLERAIISAEGDALP